jgi:hypothetical protein
MKNNYYLVCSSCLYLVSVIYFIYNFKNNNFEILLSFLLLSNAIVSVLFWRKGEYKSNIHKLDGLIGKLSFILFLFYTLLLKEYSLKYHKLTSIILIIIVLLLFYISNKFSKKSWCSRKHIIVHSIFHLFSTVTTLTAFI